MPSEQSENAVSQGELTVELEENDGMLNITAKRGRMFRALDGEETSAPVIVADLEIPAENEELALEISDKLRSWYADQQPTGAPGQKPIHQQMNEAYDR